MKNKDAKCQRKVDSTKNSRIRVYINSYLCEWTEIIGIYSLAHIFFLLYYTYRFDFQGCDVIIRYSLLFLCFVFAFFFAPAWLSSSQFYYTYLNSSYARAIICMCGLLISKKCKIASYSINEWQIDYCAHLILYTFCFVHLNWGRNAVKIR